MRKNIFRFLTGLGRWINLGLLLAIPVLWIVAVVLPLRAGLIHADGVFVLVMLSFLAMGAALAVVKLGELKESRTNWLQGAALVTELGGMFAACGLIGELPHAVEAAALVNHFAGAWWNLSPLNPQWSLFLLFTLLFAAAIGWFCLLGCWFAGEPDKELDAFRDALRRRMERLGRELDWGISAFDVSGQGTVQESHRFTPLEAQVERRGKNSRQYSDLLSCLRRNRRGGRVFLLKGDPGAGKSVALRKLSIDLLKDGGKTLPVYLNLKEWKYGWDRGWSNEEKQKKLRDFALETLRRDVGGASTRNFLRDRFPTMLEQGNVYFLLDSFDELPCLLGQENDRDLIPDISGAIYQFLIDAGQGGVVASREYRSPTRDIQAEITLYIQEFDERRIRMMLDRYLPNAGGDVWEALTGREDLLALCRNPFHLTLLINYIHGRGGNHLPEKQVELYEGFLIQQVREILLHGESKGEEAENLAKQLTKKATELALFLQEKNQNECSLSDLTAATSDLFSVSDGRGELELLERIRLCRFGGGEEEKTVTFIHRRFQEYFLVLEMQKKRMADEREMRESIVGYTKNRDACVLYCEVAKEEDAKKIATFCWDTVKPTMEQYREKNKQNEKKLQEQKNQEQKKNQKQRKENQEQDGIQSLEEDQTQKREETERLVNTLLFMADAFRTRHDTIAFFQKELEDAVLDALETEKDLFVQYALVSAMVLFRPETLQESVLRVFSLQSRWLDDVVMKNCRLIQGLNQEILSAFCCYFRYMEPEVFLRRFWSTRFALSISAHFRRVYFYHSLLYAQFLMIRAALVISWGILLLRILSIPFGWNLPFMNNSFEEQSRFSLLTAVAVVLYLYIRRDNGPERFRGFNSTWMELQVIFQGVVIAVAIPLAPCWTLYSLPGGLVLMAVVTDLPWVLLDIKVAWPRVVRAGAEYRLAVILFGIASVSIIIFWWNHETLFAAAAFLCSFAGVWSIASPHYDSWSEIFHGFVDPLQYSGKRRRDYKWVKRQRDILILGQSMDRKDFAAYMGTTLKTVDGRIQYGKLLEERKVRLRGNWPETDWRETFLAENKDEELSHALTVLEWGETQAGQRVT